VFCALPPAPPTLDGRDDDDTFWVARGLSYSGDGFLVASTLRWLLALLLPWGGEGEGDGEEACGIPGGDEEDIDPSRPGGTRRGGQRSTQAGGGGRQQHRWSRPGRGPGAGDELGHGR
jgi:hypothetical protein